MTPTRTAHKNALNVCTYNIQVGIGSIRGRHILTHGWRYLMPHRHGRRHLELIAQALREFDIVGVQEADAGSFRTGYLNQARFLAMRARFPHWYSQVTREVGNIARMTCSLLSRLPWVNLTQHRLPASRHGRVAIEATLRLGDHHLAVIVTHLSLRQASRQQQMHFLAQRLNRHKSAILMGDLNCGADAQELADLLQHTRLILPATSPLTFPSWRPRRRLDHILVSDDLCVEDMQALPLVCSDHLPVAARVRWRD